jgi:hypothetical protein
MPQSVQTPDSRILWPPQHSPATSKVFAQNTIEIAASPGHDLDAVDRLYPVAVMVQALLRRIDLAWGAAPKRKIEISFQNARILLRTGD